MKQYCRYCVNAYLQGDDMIWCKPKDEIRTDRQITRLNRCPHFEFCSILEGSGDWDGVIAWAEMPKYDSERK